MAAARNCECWPCLFALRGGWLRSGSGPENANAHANADFQGAPRQYNAKLTVLLRNKPVDQLLAAGVKGARAFIPGKSTVSSHVLSGSQVRLLSSTANMAIAMAYQPGGKLIQVVGGAPDKVLNVMSAYLAASADL